MSFEIQFSDLWTYNKNRKVKKSSDKESLKILDNKDYTHIHGELQIIINGKLVPSLGFAKNKDVCFGEWIDGLTEVMKAFKSKQKECTILGWEQGFPVFKFEKEGKIGYLSIIADEGKAYEDWQRKEFIVEEFYSAFIDFKDRLLNEIRKQSPNMVETWGKRFEIDSFPYEKYLS